MIKYIVWKFWKIYLVNKVDFDISLEQFCHSNHSAIFCWNDININNNKRLETRKRDDVYVSFWIARDVHTLHILQDFTRTQTICHTHSLHLHKYISLDEVEWEFLAWIVWEIEKGRDGTWLNLWAWTTQSW